MKHLPNLLTLANLFCGCIAIAYILTAQPYISLNIKEGMPTWNWVYGAEQIYLGSIFIGIAAICDMLDGLTARALKVYSPIGKDLDSLADVVSFGVAPSVILFKYLWDAMMSEKNAMDVSIIGMAPAFLIACFAALRLAKFNITSETQKTYFIGMPTPAVGLFVASLPLISWYNPFNIASYFQNKWVLYTIIAILCWLMVSHVKFIKLVPAKWSLAYMWPQLALVLLTIVAIVFLQVLAIPVAFILYMLLSFIYKQPEAIENNIEG
ncbi:MAG: CDP-alcohol phosphatidyltransferase family protein [Chitinophagales bacterium]